MSILSILIFMILRWQFTLIRWQFTLIRHSSISFRCLLTLLRHSSTLLRCSSTFLNHLWIYWNSRLILNSKTIRSLCIWWMQWFVLSWSTYILLIAVLKRSIASLKYWDTLILNLRDVIDWVMTSLDVLKWIVQ